MKKLIHVASKCTFLVGISFFSSAWAKLDCSKMKMEVKGKTIAECQKAAEAYSDNNKFGECIGQTAWMASWSKLESACNKGVMNASLDKRLLNLKANSAERSHVEFKKEMKLQEFFLQGVSEHCESADKDCKGTLYSPIRAGCPGELFAIRAAQAELINKKELNFPDPSDEFTEVKSKLPVAYDKYAKLLCEMPSEVWKNGKAPATCADRVLSALKYEVPEDCQE